MRAMILAAGRGKRMGELTRDTPKPLLKIKDTYLIEYAIHALVKACITDIVINVCYHAKKIQETLGNGSRYGATFHYSVETEALETGGGIYQALPLLGEQPFLVISSDIITEYPIHNLPSQPPGLAHLVLVDNPSFHSEGDFSLLGQRVYYGKEHTYTYSNIGIYQPTLFAECRPGRFRLGELLKSAILKQQITGEYYAGVWHNVGTPEDLRLLS